LLQHKKIGYGYLTMLKHVTASGKDHALRTQKSRTEGALVNTISAVSIMAEKDQLPTSSCKHNGTYLTRFPCSLLTGVCAALCISLSVGFP